MHMFIYNILPNKKERGFEVNFDVVWSMIQVGKDRHHITDKPKDEK